MRVVQRNLVYVVGLPLSICREEVSGGRVQDWLVGQLCGGELRPNASLRSPSPTQVLGDRQFFGQYGRIKKISINRSTPFAQAQKNGPSGSAYVTYVRWAGAPRRGRVLENLLSL